MLDRTRKSIFIQEDTCAADHALHPAFLSLQGKVCGRLLQADRTDSLIREPIEHILSVLVLATVFIINCNKPI